MSDSVTVFKQRSWSNVMSMSGTYGKRSLNSQIRQRHVVYDMQGGEESLGNNFHVMLK